MARRADSCTPVSTAMRHQVRRRWREWESIGASGQVLDWIRHGVRVPFKGGLAPAPFHNGVSLLDATPEQLAFLEQELTRFQVSGAWEPGTSASWVSRCFLVPKGIGKWRLIIDLRDLNRHCVTKHLKFETLKRLRYLARRGDWFISFDLMDGFYAVGIAPEDRKYFTVNIRGTLYQLAGLPMGWSLSPYVFHQFCHTFVRHFRSPEQAPKSTSSRRVRSTTTTRARPRGRKKGVRLLPFVDDFAFFASSAEEATELRAYVVSTLMQLGLQLHPDKGYQEPVQIGDHLGLTIDLERGEFRAPVEKLQQLSRLAGDLLRQASSRRRWVRVRDLAKLAGKAQFLYLAIAPARYYLRELHEVVGQRTSWAGQVRLTKQLKRDLLWWKDVPSSSNGRSIFSPVETAYLHCDSSSFGWGGVLNEHLEARGYWYGPDRDQHITWKELKAVRLTVETFLEQLRGRFVLLHEDNMAVVSVLTHLTSRSPAMMAELRKLFFLLDSNDIRLRPRYINTAANIWADRLSRERDMSDWQLNPRLFRYLDRRWGAHTVDRFAAEHNAQVARYNSRWLDAGSEAVDCLRLSDEAWRQERNWCNPPWELLDDLVVKLQQSGASATVIAPRWPGKSWHQLLHEMADEVIVYPPSRDLFFPGQRGRPEGVGMTAWSVEAFNIPCRAGST